MEKILTNRLNELKSKFSNYRRPKLDKYLGQDDFILQDFRSRIDEVTQLLKKLNE
jgi:hypothetical protein